MWPSGRTVSSRSMPISAKVCAVCSGVYFSKKCFSSPQIGNAAALRATRAAPDLAVAALDVEAGAVAPNAGPARVAVASVAAAFRRKLRRVENADEVGGVIACTLARALADAKPFLFRSGEVVHTATW